MNGSRVLLLSACVLAALLVSAEPTRGMGLVAPRLGAGTGWASAVAVQSDHAVVAAGSWANDLALVRLRGGGSRETTIRSLEVRPTQDGALVRWRTGSERRTARFEVYRGRRSGGLVPVYPRPAAAGGLRHGAAYSVSDRYRGPAGSRPVYWLIEVKRNGRRITYGPVVG